MPELPEVETMVRGLRPVVCGQILRRFEVLDPLLFGDHSAEEVKDRVECRKIQRVERRGKWVLFELEPGGGVIVIQPRMTGGFWLVAPQREDHARLIFHLDGSTKQVWYCDTRRLGRVSWHEDLEATELACDRSQGPDALVIGERELADRLKRTSRGIKPALMDQKVLAGLGNIYADEVLWRASLHPSRRADRLSLLEQQALHAAIRPVLEQAIAAEGSSFDAGYRTVLGLEGGFLAENAVHRRAGEACKRCGELIVKVYMPGLIGRPTYFCPWCQKLKRVRSR